MYTYILYMVDFARKLQVEVLGVPNLPCLTPHACAILKFDVYENWVYHGIPWYTTFKKVHLSGMSGPHLPGLDYFCNIWNLTSATRRWLLKLTPEVQEKLINEAW